MRGYHCCNTPGRTVRIGVKQGFSIHKRWRKLEGHFRELQPDLGGYQYVGTAGARYVSVGIFWIVFLLSKPCNPNRGWSGRAATRETPAAASTWAFDGYEYSQRGFR